VGAAAVRLGLASSPVTVRLLGGDLVIEVGAEDDANDGLSVFKTGPAEEICSCELSDELLRRLGWPAPAIH
jgi:diaminopimelate epimerase